MTSFRDALPQLGDSPFLTDSGLETDLMFNRGFDLPHFASYPLLDDDAGRRTLLDYFDEHAHIAADAGLGVVLETPTWRANRDWGERLGHDNATLHRLNSDAVALVERVRRHIRDIPVVVSGNLGPRGDGYTADNAMSVQRAADYHAAQIESFAGTNADLVTVLTMTYAAEAAGIVRAASAVQMPVVVSFTVETDGRLPDGTALGDAVRAVDDETSGAAAYFMVNCAHPEHVMPAVEEQADWWPRVRGVRANASRMSHAELDASDVLDDGDPIELGGQLVALRRHGMNILGGCCGTDARHIRQVASRLAPTVPAQRAESPQTPTSHAP